MKIRGTVILLFSFIINSSGQYFSTGQDPASVRWKEIKTPAYKIIFPASFEHKAQYLANIMDLVVRHETASLTAKTPRVPIILHTRSTLSNGITVWAPKRIELYTCPPQQSYAEEWLEQLAIHEYRHAVQISKINRGFSKVLYYLFGEQITGGILGLYIPTWFLEGDATATETALSKTGRGRSALFESTLRAQLLEKGAYSYDKATLGSYKTFTPDAYSLGYFIVGQARKQYGTGVWNEALDRTAKYPFMFVPFNSGVRKSTGLWKVPLYRQSLQALDSGWKKQSDAQRPAAYRMITKRDRRNYASYNQPLFFTDSTIVAEKVSMDDVTRFVSINWNTGKEKIVLTPGPHIDGSLSCGGGWLAWSEFERGRRWQNLGYSRIRLYHSGSGKISELTRRSRYFAPAVSPDGTRVAAVYISPENQCRIDLIEISSGKAVISFPIPDGSTVMNPDWSPDGHKLVFTLLSAQGAAIAILDTRTGVIRNVVPFQYNEITGPSRFYKQYILFSMSHAGMANIFAVDTASSTIFRVTSSRFAAYHPHLSGDQKTMIWSDYTSDGAMVAETPIDPAGWIPVDNIADRPAGLSETLAKQERVNIQDSVLRRNIWKLNSLNDAGLKRDTIVGALHSVTKYSKFLHLFTPHSWAPLSIDAGNLEVKPGIMALSQNLLGTMTAQAGWEYDLNERTGKFFAGFSYEGWYPALNLQFDIGNRAAWARVQGSSEKRRFTWQESNLKFHASIPWNFSHGRYSRYLTPSVGTTLIGIRHHASTPETFTSGLIQTLDYSLAASQYQRSDAKDVYPRLGQVARLDFRHSPFGSNDMGSILAAQASLYVPGIIRHQGIWIYAGYQQKREKDNLAYSYADLIGLPRGFSDIDESDLLSCKVNYKFPLIYPDLSAGSVIYLKRVKMNLFYDFACGWYGPDAGHADEVMPLWYQSTGAELTFDFHLLRFVYPFEMGVRSVYFPMAGGWGWEFLYSVTVN